MWDLLPSDRSAGGWEAHERITGVGSPRLDANRNEIPLSHDLEQLRRRIGKGGAYGEHRLLQTIPVRRERPGMSWST